MKISPKNFFRLSNLSEQLSLDFGQIALTMNEIKKVLGEVHNSHVVFNKATSLASTQINQAIYGSLADSMNTWCSQMNSSSKIITQFLEKSFKYTSQELESLEKVRQKFSLKNFFS